MVSSFSLIQVLQIIISLSLSLSMFLSLSPIHIWDFSNNTYHGTKRVLDLGKEDHIPLFHPQIIKLSNKMLAFIKHWMFIFAASWENDLVCICDEAMPHHKWGSLCLPHFHFSKALLLTPLHNSSHFQPINSETTLQSHMLKTENNSPASPLLFGQNKIESSQRVEKPHELRPPKWSSASQTTWKQQAPCGIGYL